MTRPGTDWSERGKRAGFDRTTGKPSGSGSGAGDPNETREDYDSDMMRDDEPAEKPTSTQPRPNISTEHQPPGSARDMRDTLDRGQPQEEDDGGRKSSLTRND